MVPTGGGWRIFQTGAQSPEFGTKPIDIVSSQLYVCHILVSKKCQLQAGTIHPRPLA